MHHRAWALRHNIDLSVQRSKATVHTGVPRDVMRVEARINLPVLQKDYLYWRPKDVLARGSAVSVLPSQSRNRPRFRSAYQSRNS